AGSLRARADELSQRGQYEEALAAYREALRHEPNDLALRYAVAVTLASLNRRAEATEAYRWVFFNGLPGSELVEKSETCLRAAGLLPAHRSIAADRRTLVGAERHGRGRHRHRRRPQRGLECRPGHVLCRETSLSRTLSARR